MYKQEDNTLFEDGKLVVIRMGAVNDKGYTLYKLVKYDEKTDTEDITTKHLCG